MTAIDGKGTLRGAASGTILIVDDDVPTTLILGGLLRRAGFRAAVAHDLASAEKLVRSSPVSLLLLDVNLPDGCGLDFCAALNADSSTSGIPIIFISADDSVQIKVRGFEAGAVDYITKPLSRAEVLARVRTHLRLRAAYDLLAELHEERLGRLASTQQSLMPLPREFPEAGFGVHLRQALSAGGDFYDVIASGDRIVDYVVADASGHDLGTALWTASFKTLLAEYATILYDPLDSCRRINESLRRLLVEGCYFTAIHARLNRVSNTLILVGAGHPPAILVAAAEKAASVLELDGDVLGVFSDAVFGRTELRVAPGDRLFLYSDGLVELDGSRERGIGRLAAACRDTAALPLDEAVSSIAEGLCAGAPILDDIVLLGIQV